VSSNRHISVKLSYQQQLQFSEIILPAIASISKIGIQQLPALVK